MTTTSDIKVIWYRRNNLGIIFRDIDAYIAHDNLPNKYVYEYHNGTLGTSLIVHDENYVSAMSYLENKGFKLFMH